MLVYLAVICSFITTLLTVGSVLKSEMRNFGDFFAGVIAVIIVVLPFWVLLKIIIY